VSRACTPVPLRCSRAHRRGMLTLVGSASRVMLLVLLLDVPAIFVQRRFNLMNAEAAKRHHVLQRAPPHLRAPLPRTGTKNNARTRRGRKVTVAGKKK